MLLLLLLLTVFEELRQNVHNQIATFLGSSGTIQRHVHQNG